MPAFLSVVLLLEYNSMLGAGGQQREQRSNLKNSNPKIGRPAKTDQEEQFKNHYMENRKKFELECELLVYIHQIFFEEIPTHPTNAKIDVAEVVRLFELYDCMPLYRTLAQLNELYYKSSSLFPEEKMRYTSLIDVSYLMRQVRLQRGDTISSYELVLLVLFFLYNQRVVNQDFFNYFKKRLEIFRNGMINGPEHTELNKMDTLIITLGLEIAIRENMMIEEEIEDEEGEGEEREAERQEEDPEGMAIEDPMDPMQKSVSEHPSSTPMDSENEQDAPE